MNTFFQKCLARVSGMSSPLNLLGEGQRATSHQQLAPLKTPEAAPLNETMKEFFHRTANTRFYAVFYLHEAKEGKVPAAVSAPEVITYITHQVPPTLTVPYKGADTVRFTLQAKGKIGFDMSAQFYRGRDLVHSEPTDLRTNLFDLLGITAHAAVQALNTALAAAPGYTAYAERCVRDDIADVRMLEEHL